jgi:hypothetical protein
MVNVQRNEGKKSANQKNFKQEKKVYKLMKPKKQDDKKTTGVLNERMEWW